MKLLIIITDNKQKNDYKALFPNEMLYTLQFYIATDLERSEVIHQCISESDAAIVDVSTSEESQWHMFFESIVTRDYFAPYPVLFVLKDVENFDYNCTQHAMIDFIKPPLMQKELELKLRLFNQNRNTLQQCLDLNSTALQAVANAVAITNPNGKIIWVNHAFTKLTGYEKEEVIGNFPRILKSDKQNSMEYERLWKTIKNGEVWQGELINRRKNGTEYIDEMTITPLLHDDSNTISHFVAIKKDITARKMHEKQYNADIELAKAGAKGRLK
ncbi:hypothetical protein BHU72_03230 [Desulfuribacillus stibiiarsenatis]|uniref:PAS domain-containing protein n=1 Tax=Desulfuribacillus stibiiarsenatis TaxID=1390249 RepID=A0A1E5L6L4_9FIRM|nr:PAS domain-containing protein [Desulfuribacillus stibiiarsenatis]OEH85807.1 hypothetical protein BHU72_03230 [Desulfuribacillus stibiiarsenatis]